MNDKQKEIAKLLWNFQSLKEEQVLKICNCSENDINYLIASKVISKEKDTKILKYNNQEINNRNIIAFDVVLEYLDRNPKLKKARHPINVSMKTASFTYDIITIKEMEVDTLFEKIDKISNSDRVIIIIETEKYNRKHIKTKRPCYICIYPPLEIVDRIN